MALPATMKAVQVKERNGPFEVVQVPLPQVGPRDVLIKVAACGICHGDVIAKGGIFPGITYPVIPGHEVVGEIVVVGSQVPSARLAVGQRAGVGWMQAQCFECDACVEGNLHQCPKGLMKATGSTRDGGYAQFIAADWSAVCRLPSEGADAEIAPLLCAGSTIFKAVRLIVKEALPGSVVAVLGIGGLGAVGIQFVRHLGFKTVAISRGNAKRQDALDLGAHVYIDASATNVAEELKKLGGAAGIIATAPHADSISDVFGGLKAGGKVVVVSAPHDPIKISAMPLISQNALTGSNSGSPLDQRNAVDFAILNDIKTVVEVYPLEKATEAFERMLAGTVRFRAVLLPWA